MEGQQYPRGTDVTTEPMQLEDRRRWTRIPGHQKLAVTLEQKGHTPVDAVVEDLSVGGIAVTVSDLAYKASPGTSIRVWFPGGSTEATIRYAVEDERSGLRIGMHWNERLPDVVADALGQLSGY